MNIYGRKSVSLFVALTLVFALASSSAEAKSGIAGIDEPIKKLFTGVASWYGKKFHGRRTASGTTYNMHQMTCAHKTLPFGTRLIVENTSNGKTCQVTVTDRGPYHGRRVLDLSKAAADKLGLDGIGNVVCYLGKVVAKSVGGTAKGIEGTAKETGETIAKLPDGVGRVAREIGETAGMPITKSVAFASKQLDKQSYRKQIERYYAARTNINLDQTEFTYWEPTGNLNARAKTGCLLLPDSMHDGHAATRSMLVSLDQDIH